MWLCPEHQKMTRVTILTNDVLLATTHVEGSSMAEDGLLYELVQNKPNHFFNDDGTYFRLQKAPHRTKIICICESVTELCCKYKIMY